MMKIESAPQSSWDQKTENIICKNQPVTRIGSKALRRNRMNSKDKEDGRKLINISPDCQVEYQRDVKLDN